MNVLLLCSIPDPREHPEWAKDLDMVAIREAVRALCQSVAVNLGTLFVPPQEAIVALVRTIMPAGHWFVIDDVALLEGNGVKLTHAVLIAGMERELECALALGRTGVKVYPIGTTHAAAGRFLGEAILDEGLGLSLVDITILDRDTVYGALFDKILSL